MLARERSERSEALAPLLLAWFTANRRDLPWRKSKTPYAVWLSEVMLQQTRVRTVEEYFPRFLQSYPTVEDLAQADLASVLKEWSGLGYYRRARALHAGAREVVERYGGKVPTDVASLRQISGIGAYTAGAIASIAFGAREPLVDGNVARVLSRVFALRSDIRSPAGNRAVWELARELLPEREPGRYNEALMELGATVCTPRAPRCESCPVRTLCQGRALGIEQELPVAKKKKQPREVHLVALVTRRGDKVLLGRRRPSGLFGGLWEPPMVEAGQGKKAGERLGALLGVDEPTLTLGAKQTHLLTHRKLHITVASARIRGEPSPASAGPYDCFVWQNPAALAGLGMSTLARRVLAGSRAPQPAGPTGVRSSSTNE